MTASRKYAENTRGKPFEPGNKGKPRGARHKVSVLAEKLMADDVKGVVSSVVTAALNGDMTACKVILDRIAPVRRGKLVKFDLPAGTDAGGLAATFDSLLRAIADGELTAEEGQAVAVVLEARRKAIETHELEARLAVLEQRSTQ